MRVRFLDIPIDVLTMDESLGRALDSMRSGRRVQHVALNVAKIVKARSDSLLRDDLLESDMVGIDGMGILLGLRIAGIKAPERVSGIDLMEELLALSAQEGYRPFFLGATRDVVARAADVACQRFPGLDMAGVHDGYFAAETEGKVVDLIRSSGADCLFVGMPTPRKERFLHKNRDILGVPFIMGVGGAFDVLAGKVQRAPDWMQRSGLEWLYRIYQEPGRMWWRYLSTNVIYAGLLAGVFLKRLTGSPKTS